VVVILNIGGVIETASWKDIPDAILLAWQAGQETGNSIADVISGKVNPSGKLASTFPVSYQDVPSAPNFPGVVTEPDDSPVQGGDPLQAFFSPKASKIVYEEGIYVGYRYYNTFNVPVSYEFGYGLSYTSFEYSGITLSSEKFNKSLTVTITVQNTGNVSGREVVQLYLSAPQGRLDKPASELKGFTKTKLLVPGESEIITFEISPRALSSFDTESSAWIADAGTYKVMIGTSSKDIRQTTTFLLRKTMTVNKESVALTPSETINEMKP
jgi:beta-glucosidase